MKEITEKDIPTLQGQRRFWAYNGLDCCVTREVWDVISPRLGPEQRATYAFERAMQAPAMAMMRRGVLVDVAARATAVGELKKDLIRLDQKLNADTIVAEVWDGKELETGYCPKGGLTKTGRRQRHVWPRGDAAESGEYRCERCGMPRYKRRPFNGNSSDQCWRLFYELLGLPVQHNKEGVASTDEECIERIGRKWPKYAKITGLILESRGTKKQLGFLAARLTVDNRFRQSINVGKPETGRFSSSKSPFGEGGNTQNIAEKHRRIFIADPGWDMVYADLEQAESRTVAYVAEDERYIQAHLSGDVHTFVSRLLWPNLPWNGDLKHDKKVAKEEPCPFDPDHDYRYNAKRCQHGLNYGLTPQGLAMWAHIPLAEAKKIYALYWEMFPGVRQWQIATAKQIKELGVITTPLGRRRQFFGRYWDPHTIRQGIAFVPQSMVADILNASLYAVWRAMDPERVQLLAQVHDAILAEVRVGDQEAVEAMRKLMTVPVPILGRVMTIPVEMQQGKNWGKYDAERNPGGLKVV